MEKDPYKYFRIEARELLEGLSRGILELERETTGKSPDKTLLNGLMRLAHTLKGASRVVKQTEISEKAHAMEDILAPHRDNGSPVNRAEINSLLKLLDTVSSLLRKIDSPPSTVVAATATPVMTVPVNASDLDHVLNGISDATVRISSLYSLDENIATAMRDEINKMERDLRKVRDQVSELRLLPASMIFNDLERAVRDAGESLHKEVRFEASGGDVRLDAHVLKAIKDALLHVVRNSVAHGIEVGCAGSIQLKVERRGSRIAFVCNDNGKGFDLHAIRKTAMERKLITEQAAMSLNLEQAIHLILHSEVSTASTVNEVSGRGVGLNILYDTVAKLKGEVVIESEAGKGTTIDACLPVSLEALSVLTVEAAGNQISVPFDSVPRTVRITDHEIAHSAEGDSILHNEKPIPFIPLSQILFNQGQRRKTAWSVVLVESNSQTIALGVDQIVSVSDALIRPLPKILGSVPLIAGAALDAKGNPRFVLDPQALIDSASSNKHRFEEAVAEQKRHIMVIDDSLTTRMLEQGILELAGYHVQLAVSAEDALVKAHQSPHSLFIVDVEMPGMSGFEFVEKTRADQKLRDTPCIMVSSLASSENRLRAENVGASAYIVKGEFDENYFLQTVGKLVG